MKYFIESDLKGFNQNSITNASRGNKFYANKMKKEMQYEIIMCFRPQHIKKIETPCKIIATWDVKDKRMDLDNLMLKNVLDALQDIDMIENDNMNHIKEIHHSFVVDVDKEKQGLEIEFLGVGENEL